MLKGGSWCPFADEIPGIKGLRTEVFSSFASVVRVTWQNLHAKEYRGLGEVDVFSLQKLGTSGIVCALSNIFWNPAHKNPTKSGQEAFCEVKQCLIVPELRISMSCEVELYIKLRGVLRKGWTLSVGTLASLALMCCKCYCYALLWVVSFISCYFVILVVQERKKLVHFFQHAHLDLEISWGWGWEWTLMNDDNDIQESRILQSTYIHFSSCDAASRKEGKAKSLANCLKIWIWAPWSRKGACVPTVSMALNSWEIQSVSVRVKLVSTFFLPGLA